jgi:hypothetical protein
MDFTNPWLDSGWPDPGSPDHVAFGGVSVGSEEVAA